MGAPVLIPDDIPAEELRRSARQESEGRVACRLLGLANVVDGMNRERAARQAGMDRQTLRSIRSGRRDPDPVGLIEG